VSSALKSEIVIRKKKVMGFTGVGTLFAIGEDQIAFICADENVLFELLRELMPKADLSRIKFQRLTIIQANEPTDKSSPA